MAVSTPRYSKTEFARLCDKIYQQKIASRHEAADSGKFVAIDIETGAFELDADALSAMNRLLARLPNAQMWLRRVGSRYAAHFGSRLERARE
ncbi:MAG TPA: hypothetical protein VGW37_15730 [Terriglobia bacterium]|nr:hypothetical protein [Terriglobia bacterium]HEV2248098.1 hypothetical protein [Terriglobia bacterium]